MNKVNLQGKVVNIYTYKFESKFDVEVCRDDNTTDLLVCNLSKFKEKSGISLGETVTIFGSLINNNNSIEVLVDELIYIKG